MDAVLLRVYQNLLESITESMGSVLERTGFSPNIKERRDYSCALFNRRRELVAHAAHIPVHIGSSSIAVKSALERVELMPGDVILLNDPYDGGTHLPDLTMVAGVFDSGGEALFYVANRAHHADVGGAVRGSMALFTEIYQEGLRIPPIHLEVGGVRNSEVESLLLANMRHPKERRGDLEAQVSSLQAGIRELEALTRERPLEEIEAACDALETAAEQYVRKILTSIPDGSYRAEEFLDEDGQGRLDLALRAALHVEGDSAKLSFDGTDPTSQGCVNANPAIVTSAVLYVLACLSEYDAPTNQGLLRPLEISIPRATLLDPQPPAAVAAGNVETSQRLVDLMLELLAQALPGKVPAQSQGTMNNLTLGSTRVSYYETIGGGVGAGPWGAGASGVHSHMTNTRNTPTEALERSLPVRVIEYSLRRGSGGSGRHAGGDGIVRKIELLEDLTVSLLTQRRRHAPKGRDGGGSGVTGRNRRLRAGEVTELDGFWSGELEAGDILSIETPGGGGWGSA